MRPYAPDAPWNALIAAVLRRMPAGGLTVMMPDGTRHHFGGTAPGPDAVMHVHDTALARKLLTGGHVALAEGYLDGLWSSPDLGAVLDLGLTNMSHGWISRVPNPLRPINRLLHAKRDNDQRGGSKRNIAYHYDLGNDFYELWLDPTMTYSAACLTDESVPLDPSQLECAQRRKWDRMLELIQPDGSDHVLEIGCGWGGFAMHAAKEAGCRVTGLTLSEEQAALARKRIAEQGLEDRIEIRLQDYREVPETFDSIVSIEMFEAVGETWWPVFFRRLKELLSPGRPAALQVITIEDSRYEDYRSDPDFIQRYIFPGGMLPSPERFAVAAQAQGLAVGTPHFFGHDYAATLESWSRRFEDALPQVRALGFDERFIRMWRYYLAYCTTGFEHGAIDVMQVRLEA